MLVKVNLSFYVITSVNWNFFGSIWPFHVIHHNTEWSVITFMCFIVECIRFHLLYLPWVCVYFMSLNTLLKIPIYLAPYSTNNLVTIFYGEYYKSKKLYKGCSNITRTSWYPRAVLRDLKMSYIYINSNVDSNSSKKLSNLKRYHYFIPLVTTWY
jgi:hypothetical protein